MTVFPKHSFFFIVGVFLRPHEAKARRCAGSFLPPSLDATDRRRRVRHRDDSPRSSELRPEVGNASKIDGGWYQTNIVGSVDRNPPRRTEAERKHSVDAWLKISSQKTRLVHFPRESVGAVIWDINARSNRNGELLLWRSVHGLLTNQV